jgi:flagellar hook-associated protein 3 FlgL
MITRVTQSMMTRQLLGSVRRIETRLLDAQDMLASGKRLRDASDDPVGTALATRVRAQGRDLEALGRTIDFATAVLSAQDDALDQAESLLVRAREIATQQAGGLATPALRQQAAAEMAEIERQLISLANTEVDGRYVFGGLASGARPFTALDDPGFDPLAPYVGPADTFSVRTGEAETVRLTTRGDQVFNDAIAAIDELRQTLAAGDPPTASIDTVEQAAEILRAERASVGGRARQLDERAAQITAELLRVTERLGDIEGADYAAVITELTQLQTALQATLGSAQTLQTSILDYLRL